MKEERRIIIMTKLNNIHQDKNRRLIEFSIRLSLSDNEYNNVSEQWKAYTRDPLTYNVYSDMVRDWVIEQRIRNQ